MSNVKIRKNDSVIIITGKDRNKRGAVVSVYPNEKKIIVEGIALRKKHQRPRSAGKKGEVITQPARIDVSNAMLYCPHCARGVRVGFLTDQQSRRKMRICKKCKKEI